MKSFQVTSALFSLLSLTAAQTPAGSTPVATRNLNAAFPPDVVTPPGRLIPRNLTANAPNLTTTVFSTTGTAIVFMIDLDIPTNTSTRNTLLHWLVPGVTGVANAGNTSTILKIPNPGIGAPYLQPNPPVGDIAHRYVLYLFEQPKTFSIPAAYAAINPPANIPARIGFNLTAFVASAGLSAPLAANYFTVQNVTANVTTPATATSTSRAATLAPETSTSTSKTSSASVAVPSKNAGVNVERSSVFALAMAAVWAVGQI